jgi:cell division protein FtsB
MGVQDRAVARTSVLGGGIDFGAVAAQAYSPNAETATIEALVAENRQLKRKVQSLQTKVATLETHRDAENTKLRRKVQSLQMEVSELRDGGAGDAHEYEEHDAGRAWPRHIHDSVAVAALHELGGAGHSRPFDSDDTQHKRPKISALIDPTTMFGSLFTKIRILDTVDYAGLFPNEQACWNFIRANHDCNLRYVKENFKIGTEKLMKSGNTILLNAGEEPVEHWTLANTKQHRLERLQRDAERARGPR